MSGGSMDYLFIKVEFADFEENNALRKQFREHLNNVAKALRAIEWNDSGDGASNEEELILKCIESDKYRKAYERLKEACVATIPVGQGLKELLPYNSNLVTKNLTDALKEAEELLK